MINAMRKERPDECEYVLGGDGCVRLALDAHCDAMRCELGAICPQESGRLLFLSVRLRAVKPGRRVALGLALYEEPTREGGALIPLAQRALILDVPRDPEGQETPRDVPVREIGFVLPADDGERRICLRAFAHYMGTDEAACCALPMP